MKNYLQIKTKTGIAYVNADEPQAYHFSSRQYSPLYRAVEAVFEQWLNNGHKEIKMAYTGSFEELDGYSYFDTKGAIREGVAAVIEYMLENKLNSITTREFSKIDICAVFEI